MPLRGGGLLFQNGWGRMDIANFDATYARPINIMRKEITAFSVCRVGDILFAGAETELLVAEEAMRAFRAGEIAKLTPQTPIIYAGSLLGRPDMGNWRIPPQKVDM